MTGTWTTTDAEDAAILALTAQNATITNQPAETVPQFIDRHIRHQVNFAVSRVDDARQAAVATLPADAKAEVDAILERHRPRVTP